MTSDYAIGDVQPDRWEELARFLARALPNPMVSVLGPSFGAKFYRALAARPDSWVLAAYDRRKALAGAVVGTLDRPRALAETMAGRRLSLALAANVRLLAPRTIRWLWQGRGGSEAVREGPSAELLAIAVREDARGTGLAQDLIRALEGFMRARGFRGTYAIRTEPDNVAANRFYEKIGARLARQYRYHRRLMNEWHKSVAAPDETRG